MNLLLIGTSHRTATVDLRSRLAQSVQDAAAQLLRAPGAAGISELCVLATCHRVEFYLVAADVDAADDALRGLVSRLTGGDLLAPGPTRYRLVGAAAVEHLCRVAAGLDSMIVGEAEIAGQIRRAIAHAKATGAAGVFLDRLVSGALRAGGRARAETRIGAGAMSAATAAVSVVEQTLDSLAHASVLVIGAGEAGRQALERLARRRTGRLTIASRSGHHAREAAEKTGARVVNLDDLADAARLSDAVIAATLSPAYLITPATYAGSSARSRLLIDLSVPRIIDPAVADVRGISLRTVDDLGEFVRASAARRAAEIPNVERIVRDEARRAYDQFRTRAARRLEQARATLDLRRTSDATRHGTANR
jgi:glutamyl-tRNA reductase